MYYVGIDGGGTNTRACILNEKKEIIGIGKSGPSSIDTVDIKVTMQSFNEAIMQVFQENKIENPQIASIFIGVGGVLTDSSKDYVRNEVKKLPYIMSDALIGVENDVYAAHLGGLGNRPGICLIVGTGSVAFGIDEDNKTHRAGGYGYQEGDAGSSYDLGKKTTQHLARVFDGRREKTAFAEDVFTSLEISGLDELMDFIMSYHLDRTKTAQLAKFVTKHADLGDFYARKICDEATDELVLCVEAVYKILNLKNKELAIIGSLGNTPGYFRTQLEAKIKQIADFHIHAPITEPVIGAALKAYQDGHK